MTDTGGHDDQVGAARGARGSCGHRGDDHGPGRDDHQLARAGLVALLSTTADLEAVGQAGDGQEALRLASELRPDVVLMDLSMPVPDGVAATRRPVAEQAGGYVVVPTSFTGSERVTESPAAFAVGYLLKDSEPLDLTSAVRSAAPGHAPLDPRVTRPPLPTSASSPAPGDLPRGRETEVLALVARGLANQQIGRTLGISEHTVKVHLNNVFRRLGVDDRTSAALWARDHLPRAQP